MKAVSDTTPICYTILIREIDVLPKLFERALLLAAVLSELLHKGAPDVVKLWARSLPPWVSVCENPPGRIAGTEKLQAAEQAAILLAESTNAGIILLDENRLVVLLRIVA